MRWLKTLLNWRAPSKSAPAITYADIIATLDPWTLACATGAANGTLGLVGADLDDWLRLSKQSWMPKLCQALPGVTEESAMAALATYIVANQHKDYKAVLHDEEKKRAMKNSFVLGPGESAETVIELKAPTNVGDMYLEALLRNGYKLRRPDKTVITERQEAFDYWHSKQAETGCVIPGHLGESDKTVSLL